VDLLRRARNHPARPQPGPPGDHDPWRRLPPAPRSDPPPNRAARGGPTAGVPAGAV